MLWDIKKIFEMNYCYAFNYFCDHLLKCLAKFIIFLPNCSLDLSIYIILYKIYDHVPSYIMSIGASIRHTLSYNPRSATCCARTRWVVVAQGRGALSSLSEETVRDNMLRIELKERKRLREWVIRCIDWWENSVYVQDQERLKGYLSDLGQQDCSPERNILE